MFWKILLSKRMQRTHAKFLAFRVFRARDGEAYRQLYQEYRDAVYRFLALKLPRHEDVDEVGSDVFLRGWEYMTSNMVEYPQALFYKIAENLIAAFYQQRARRPQEALTDAMEETIPGQTSLAEEVAAADGMAKLLEKIDQLKDEYRQVLLLKYVDELSVEEIAVQLGKTANNVRVILFRARESIKKIL